MERSAAHGKRRIPGTGYVFFSLLFLGFPRFERVTTGLGGVIRLILVLAVVSVLAGKLFFKVCVSVTVHFHHDHVGGAVVAFAPVFTVGDTAFDDGHVFHLLGAILHHKQTAYTPANRGFTWHRARTKTMPTAGFPGMFS
jgi:hypothetical protein